MATIQTAQPNYTLLWNSIELRPEWTSRIRAAIKIIEINYARYERFVKDYNEDLPPYVVGVIHYMESTCNFTKHLHNGDSLKARTIQEPKGRPIKGTPPFTWEQSATDALNLKGYAQLHDWSIGYILRRLEQYNGTGYIKRGINTPYLWSGTEHYLKGKYIADGVFDKDAISKQVGAAPILMHWVNKG